MLCYMLRVASRCVMLPVAGTTCYALCHKDYGVRIYVEIVSLPEGGPRQIVDYAMIFRIPFFKEIDELPKAVLPKQNKIL